MAAPRRRTPGAAQPGEGPRPGLSPAGLSQGGPGLGRRVRRRRLIDVWAWPLPPGGLQAAGPSPLGGGPRVRGRRGRRRPRTGAFHPGGGPLGRWRAGGSRACSAVSARRARGSSRARRRSPRSPALAGVARDGSAMGCARPTVIPLPAGVLRGGALGTRPGPGHDPAPGPSRLGGLRPSPGVGSRAWPAADDARPPRPAAAGAPDAPAAAAPLHRRRRLGRWHPRDRTVVRPTPASPHRGAHV
jgi:hypothetical protein